VLDFLAIAVADLASIAERRTDRFLDVARNQGLPPFLADDPGVDSGLMIAQYTAGGDRVRAASASPRRRASTRSRPRRCRRTTSRWGGRRPASCAGPSTG
jgi:histidine ammonia-lyase